MSVFLVRPIKILESPHHVVFYRHSKAYVVSVESLSVPADWHRRVVAIAQCCNAYTPFERKVNKSSYLTF